MSQSSLFVCFQFFVAVTDHQFVPVMYIVLKARNSIRIILPQKNGKTTLILHPGLIKSAWNLNERQHFLLV